MKKQKVIYSIDSELNSAAEYAVKVINKEKSNMFGRWPKPKRKQPSIATLEKYTYDSVCPATDGCRVEPDGICQHGYPSWLIYLGYI